ncbi:hypothetical protein LCGC14_2103340, partial [marine sediment metagenome]
VIISWRPPLPFSMTRSSFRKTIQESNGSFGYILAKLEERYIRVHAIPRSVTIRIFTDDEGGPVDVEFVEGEPGYPGDRAKRTLAGYDYEITLK